MAPISLLGLQKKVLNNERLAMLTCYDASFAALMEEAGVDILLVGDSLGMVLKGEQSTLSVSMDEMIYHTKCVTRSAKNTWVIADMPFGSYQPSKELAFENAARLMAVGAHMVKIEGGSPMLETMSFLTERGVPVCGHLGLTPQAVHQLGGFRVQGRSDEQALRLIEEAKALEAAGAGMIVLEMIPASLAEQITEALTIPTIGIGAGVKCDGQVLVLHDMLGIFAGKSPRFSKNFMQEAHSIQEAVACYVKQVKEGLFPAPEHSY